MSKKMILIFATSLMFCIFVVYLNCDKKSNNETGKYDLIKVKKENYSITKYKEYKYRTFSYYLFNKLLYTKYPDSSELEIAKENYKIKISYCIDY